MSILSGKIADHKLFVQFDQLVGFENVSRDDVDVLKAKVLEVARYIEPHLEQIPKVFAQYTDHKIQHLLNIADHVHDFLPRRDVNGKSVIAINAVELTFLWLAILLHDIGMFVASLDEKQKLLDSDAYKEHLRHHRDRLEAAQLAQDAGHTVRAETIRDAVFAEFIRRRHAERVHDYIHKHFPTQHGKGLLHFRDIDLAQDVGRLCESHNWGVRQSRDPRRPEQCVLQLKNEDLIGKTPVNFVYLACCLRLGDILDFDRSRTPMSAFHQNYFTESVSIDEWKKHLSIKGVKVTEHRAVYSAECEEPADYVAVQQFLNWVDQELQECTRIVREFSTDLAERYQLNLAPVVDRFKIGMKDPNYVAGAFRFQLEYDQIMRLLMDKSLYPDEILFLRELLQNALDACRYQTARAQAEEMGDKYISRIQVWDGSQLPHNKDRPLEGPRIVFQDNGTGMSLSQVENFFMRVGKSYYRSAEFNAERERLQEQGIHLDACSQFGIGFLSCFLGGDRIEVETFQYGSEPLEILIEGPKKYFTIKRLPKPSKAIPFKSPPDPAKDCPPHYAGTKITVFLRDGWRMSTAASSADLVYEALDTVAVNQEIPITVTSSANGTHRIIPARRWNEVPHPSSVFRQTELFDAIVTPSILSLSDVHPSLRGHAAIWFLSDHGIPVPRLGDLLVLGDRIATVQFLGILRDFCSLFAGTTAARTKSLVNTLVQIHSSPSECAVVYKELTDQLAGFRGLMPSPEEFQSFCHGDIELAIEAFRSLPKLEASLERFWYETAAEIGVLRSRDRTELVKMWRQGGVTRGGAILMESEYRFALFGVESPGGFQTWDAVRGFAERHDWLPRGVSLCLDTYGDLAPQPAASRLFVPFERSEEVRAVVTRAIIAHAYQLWKSHLDEEDWTDWYLGFIRSWGAVELNWPLEHDEWREQRYVLCNSVPLPWQGASFWQSLAALHSEFGRIVLTTNCDGFSPYIGVVEPISSEHIQRAAQEAEVPTNEVEQTVHSLSEWLGWDIRQGKPDFIPK